VTSNKMDKSVTVRVDRLIHHREYKRYVRRTAKLMAHDPANACNVGDRVEIAECRPLSTRKRWRVVRVVRAAVGGGVELAEPAAVAATPRARGRS
jgi:small subunit ribosomal protein S17